jgi:hypothetical protein
VVGAARAAFDLDEGQLLELARVLRPAGPQALRHHRVVVADQALERTAQQPAAEALARVGADLAGPGLAHAAQFELVVGRHGVAEDTPVDMFQRRPRPGVGADAHADGHHLHRLLAQPHHQRRSAGSVGVGVERDGHALEQAGLLQPFLVVQQQGLGDRRAGP